MADERFSTAPPQKLSVFDNLFLISLLVGPIIYLFIAAPAARRVRREEEKREREEWIEAMWARQLAVNRARDFKGQRT